MDGIFCKFCNIKVKNRLLYCTNCLQMNEIYCCKTPKQKKLDLCKRCFKINRKFCQICRLKIVLPYEYPLICEKCHSAQYKQCVGFKDNNCQEKIPKYGRLRYKDRCKECFKKNYIDKIRTIRNKK